ncbi:helix-turn-helix domain-containing protein [Nocardia nova]|uniref:helix-turn-helix domain-containing protein n=1 Tax=Nocardia nova TaxID=37330 RepID=UPI001893A671|nr:helix-turn-helix domain-containing protein [Nocardia nova]MBF6144236.1 helix-turn-helix domain-containing protein [Nocardia nova]
MAKALQLCSELVARRGQRLPTRILGLADVLAASVRGSMILPVASAAEHSPPVLPVFDPVSTAEAAELLGTTTSAVRQRLRRRTLPGHRIGGRWVIDRLELAAIVEKETPCQPHRTTC